MQIQHFSSEYSTDSLDIRTEQVGYEMCAPSHSFGPAVRKHCLIHYVKRGKGVFEYKNHKVEVSRNEMFLIYPDEVTYYKADADDPWEYYWFGFSGNDSEKLVRLMGFSEDLRKVRYSLSSAFSLDGMIEELTHKKMLSYSDKIYEVAKIYEIFSWIIKSGESKGVKSTENALLLAAKEFLRRSYTHDIKISDAAMHIGCDRTQLYRYFKDSMGVSPQQYLLDIRMKEALNLITGTQLKIKQIAYSVGYQDQYLFSKMFKKIYGLSPKQYRESL